MDPLTPNINRRKFLQRMAISASSVVLIGCGLRIINCRSSSQFAEAGASRIPSNHNLNGWSDTDLPEEIWQPTWTIIY
ncbi:MAG: hypothetical protein COA74_03610 [Gammaproteobacteria bacterium]|nr:MAG: hypothetical protein COA74_03610 [Gammaproteobacteria bacterium]